MFEYEALERRILEKIYKVQKVSSQMRVSVHEAEELEEYMGRTLVARLEAFVLADKMSAVVAKVPNSVWDYFKLMYMPKCITRRFPVVYRDIVADFTVSFPNYKLSTEHIGRGYVTITST